MTYKTTWNIRYRTTDYEWYRIYKGYFRKEDAAYEKIEELKRDQNVTEIILIKKDVNNITKPYKWSNGFEVVRCCGC